jgi:predicted RNase H-like HicB family nuclease
MKHNYLVIYEEAEDGSVSAYAPELQPGVVATTGKDYAEARAMIAEAISLYLEEMRNSKQPVAPSPVRYELLEVASYLPREHIQGNRNFARRITGICVASLIPQPALKHVLPCLGLDVRAHHKLSAVHAQLVIGHCRQRVI